MIIFSKNVLMNYNTEDIDPTLELWEYENLSNGKKLLTNYIGSDYQNTIYVPSTNTVINSGVFYNNQNVKSVDLQFTPFVNNNMSQAFYNCRNLTSVYNINQNVTTMSSCFYQCSNFNQNIQIPNSVTNMSSCFYFCNRLNQNIQIPNSVTNIYWTFFNCTNLTGSINILTTSLSRDGSYRTFFATTLSKKVYIYYQYDNGVNTRTYNLVVLGNYNGTSSVNTNLKWHGQNGVTVYNLGKAPW